MSKKHDENKDLRSFARIGKVVYSDKTLRTSKTSLIGIHMWGKIDYLTHYCGWRLVWDNVGVGVTLADVNESKAKKDKPKKKPAKAPKEKPIKKKK